MNRLSLIEDSKGNLILHSNNNSILYINNDAVLALNSINKKKKIKNVEEKGDNVLIIYYDDLKVVLNCSKKEYSAKNLNLISDYLKCALNFHQKSIKKSKVTRENKHSGKTIIAASVLVLASLAGGIIYNNVKESSNINNAYENVSFIASEKMPDYQNYDNLNFDVESLTLENQNIQYEGDITSYENLDNYHFINYSDRIMNSKHISCINNYGKIIQKYAEMYGVDADLLCAIATQERGEHCEIMDPGGATGLMQIQNSVWIGHSITAYNFVTNSWDKLTVTDNNIKDLETNIQLGAMILNNNFQYFKDPIAAVQAYNYGNARVASILTDYCLLKYGTDDYQVLFENGDYDWLSPDVITVYNKNGYTIGDPNYICNVLSFNGSNQEISFKIVPSSENTSVEEKTILITNNIEYCNVLKR